MSLCCKTDGKDGGEQIYKNIISEKKEQGAFNRAGAYILINMVNMHNKVF